MNDGDASGGPIDSSDKRRWSTAFFVDSESDREGIRSVCTADDGDLSVRLVAATALLSRRSSLSCIPVGCSIVDCVGSSAASKFSVCLGLKECIRAGPGLSDTMLTVFGSRTTMLGERQTRWGTSCHVGDTASRFPDVAAPRNALLAARDKDTRGVCSSAVSVKRRRLAFSCALQSALAIKMCSRSYS